VIERDFARIRRRTHGRWTLWGRDLVWFDYQPWNIRVRRIA
jgi:Ser/Thr protein kinase RdoA (MazF antagonist)